MRVLVATMIGFYGAVRHYSQCSLMVRWRLYDYGKMSMVRSCTTAAFSDGSRATLWLRYTLVTT